MNILVPPIEEEIAEVVQMIRTPVIEFVAPAPAVSYTMPAPVNEGATPAPSSTYATPVPVIEHVTCPRLAASQEAVYDRCPAY